MSSSLQWLLWPSEPSICISVFVLWVPRFGLWSHWILVSLLAEFRQKLIQKADVPSLAEAFSSSFSHLLLFSYHVRKQIRVWLKCSSARRRAKKCQSKGGGETPASRDLRERNKHIHTVPHRRSRNYSLVIVLVINYIIDYSNL